MGTLLFKANYKYKLIILLIPKQAKKRSLVKKVKVKIFIN